MFCNVARAVALAATLITALPTMAQERAVEVRHADLDLTSATGRSALDRRVARAADRICGAVDIRDTRMMSAKRRCVAGTVRAARPAIELAQRNAMTGGVRLAR
jgi:UrcA family protein